MALTADAIPASEPPKGLLPTTVRQPLSSLLYPKVAKASSSSSSHEVPLQSPTVPHPGKRLPSPPRSPAMKHPEWPLSSTAPGCTPVFVLSPAPELMSPLSTTSPFPTSLPPRPQLAQTGNFISRLFMRAPAHPCDVELGTLPQRRTREARVMTMGDKQRRRDARAIRIKIAGAVLVIIGFWVLVGLEVWRRQRGEGYDGIEGRERRS